MSKKGYCASLVLLSSSYAYSSVGEVYKVQEGENLNLILNKYMSYKVGPSKSALLDDIMENNNLINNPHLIYSGDKIKLPELEDIYYIVKPKDTLGSIVKKHRHLAPHLSFHSQLKRTISENTQLKDPDKIEIGDKVYLGKVFRSIPVEHFAVYDVKPGDNIKKVLSRHYNELEMKNIMSFVRTLNPGTYDFGNLKKDMELRLPTRKYMDQVSVSHKSKYNESIDRAIASLKSNKPKYYYEDELGFEIRKMDRDQAREYIDYFKELTDSNSVDKWKQVFNDIQRESFDKNHENMGKAFYLYSIDIEEDGNVARTRGEFKKFLKVWKEARELRGKVKL